MPGVLLPVGLALLLAACGQVQPEIEHTTSKEAVLSVTSEFPVSDPEQSDSSAPSTEAASSPEAPEESAPDPPAKIEENHIQAPSSVPEVPRPVTPPVTSRPLAPPETSTPSAELPTVSAPDPEIPTSRPDLSSEPEHTEKDDTAIIEEIRRYGEAKGFIWNDTLTFGGVGVGYYGRPNLTDDGVDGVISMLKYHCDKIEREYDICYFHAIQREYEGKTEFIVLYA